jgi:hypothetical protein
MKLLDLLELDKPENVYNPEYVAPPEAPNKDFMKKGYKISKSTVNPETGTVSSEVEYLPEFKEIRRRLIIMRESFQPFMYSSNEDIATVAKEINTGIGKLNKLIFALDKMVELQGKRK